MRGVIWLVVLFAGATALALFMGGNNAVVTLFWAPWRVDVSLNVFILSVIVLGVALYVLLRGLDVLLSLPERARLWRAQRRDLQANTLLQEAVLQVLAGRYSRSQKAAAAAISALRSSEAPTAQRLLEPLAWLVKAESAHRLQDQPGRDAAAHEARAAAQRNKARFLDEAADLRAAAWTLDDRQAGEALRLLDNLAPGVARRTVALRLRLKAARLAGDTRQALHTARLLDKHHAFGRGQPMAGIALLRRLAQDQLAQARDLTQLQKAWAELDIAERQDPFVASFAALRWASLGDPSGARQCLTPVWDAAFKGLLPRLDTPAADTPKSGEARPSIASDKSQAREALARAVVMACEGMEATWLARLEEAALAFPREAAPAWAAGMAFAAAGLWGKARMMLQQALRPVASAAGGALTARDAAMAWQAMGQLAERDGDGAAALAAYKQAAELAAASLRA